LHIPIVAIEKGMAVFGKYFSMIAMPSEGSAV
jgi:hypothetical protein